MSEDYLSELDDIKVQVEREVSNLVMPFIPKIHLIHQHLVSTGERLEIFNGTCELVTVKKEGAPLSAIAIENEQNLDYLILLNDPINLYTFEHYYDETGFDQSLLRKVLENNNLDDYQPTYVFEENCLANADVVYRLKHLNDYSFTLTLGSILGEISDGEDPEISEMSWYHMQEGLSRRLHRLFSQAKGAIRTAFEEANVQPTATYFVADFGPDENEALVFKTTEVQFVAAFPNWFDDDYEIWHEVKFYELPLDVVDLRAFKPDYRCRPFYKFHYTYNKKRARNCGHPGENTDIYYYAKIKALFELLCAKTTV
jgi:hypothetical protein